MKLNSTIVYIIFVALTSCMSTQNHITSESFELANQYAKDGLYKEAIQHYEVALKDARTAPIVYKNLGMVYVKVRNFKKAKIYLDKALEVNKNSFEANYYMGEVYRAQGQVAKAIYYYQTANTIIPNDIRNLRSLAWAYYRSRFYSEAYSVAQKLHSLNKVDYQGNVILARTMIKLQKFKGASTLLKTAIRNNNNGSKPYLYSVLGDVYYESGEFTKAEQAYSLALKDTPLLASALYGYGRCLSIKGDKQNAISYWEKAIKSRPSFTDVYYSLGKAYEGKDNNKSVYFYKKFRSLAYLDIDYIERVKETKDRLSFLQSSKKPESISKQ